MRSWPISLDRRLSQHWRALWRRREGIDELVDRLRAAHPGLRANAAHPVGETRHEAEILDDVLFADQPHRDNATGSDGADRNEIGQQQCRERVCQYVYT